MNADTIMFIAIVAVSLIGFVVVGISNQRSKERAKTNGGIDPKIAEAKAKSQAIKDAYSIERDQRALAQTVVKTKILDSHSIMTSKGSVTSSAGRAAVGSFIAGPIGAVVGASTGKRTYHEHKSTTFKVWYGDGSTKIKTVSNGSYDWKRYMEKLEE